MIRPYHHGALREALLAAAESILERDGIGALTLRAAAREAGVSHAAPAHHFGDISGLLSELAASGFVRFRECMRAEAGVPGLDAQARLVGLGRGYVRFARASPGLFLLMFRSERLDWSRPTLATAGAEAFALLTEQQVGSKSGTSNMANLAMTTARWSLAHGLSMLLIDGRLGPVTDRIADADIDGLVEATLTSGHHPGQ